MEENALEVALSSSALPPRIGKAGQMHTRALRTLNIPVFRTGTCDALEIRQGDYRNTENDFLALFSH
jgi:hypothetical protein